MTIDDIDEFLRKKWIEALNLYNDKLINDLLIKSFEAKQDVLLNKIRNKEENNKKSISYTSYTLKYRGKFYFVIGKYEQAIADLTKLLEFEPNNAFSLKYQGEAYFMMKKYEESRTCLNKLSTNYIWVLEVCNEITRK